MPSHKRLLAEPVVGIANLPGGSKGKGKKVLAVEAACFAGHSHVLRTLVSVGKLVESDCFHRWLNRTVFTHCGPEVENEEGTWT